MQLSRLACAGLLLGVALDDPSAEDYVRDVRLEIGWLGSPAVLENPTSPPPVTARLVNESDTRTYPVLGAGGGSRRGPVQPSMRWSLERLATKGSWSAWDSGARGTRADSLGSDWREGVVALGPGASLDLRLADLFFNVVLSQSPAGSYRARAHYSVAAGDESAPASLRGVPAYELVSEPVEFEYAPPFTVEVDAIRSWTPDETAAVGALIDARLVNRSGARLSIPRPNSSARSAFVRRFPSERKDELAIEWPELSEPETEAEPADSVVHLEPGESITVFGPDGLYPADEYRLSWTGATRPPEVAPPIGVVVRLRVIADRPPLSVSSAPIAIPLAR